MIRINWKKTLLITTDILLGVYLILAVTAFNQPDDTELICSQVKIDITDSQVEGFLNTEEIKKILQQKKIYPLGKPISQINCRTIKETLMASPFIDKVQCYKTQNGHINISLTQRMPIVRIMAGNGANYYLDNHGGVMRNMKYTADIIIATGKISQKYAQGPLSKVADVIIHSKLWNNQIEQINVLDDGTMELVPRVGEHIIYIGDATDIEQKLDRLEKFYRYGLSKAGWNKYKYISVEFSNQIICRRNDDIESKETQQPAVPQQTETQQQPDAQQQQPAQDNEKKEQPQGNSGKPAPDKNNKTIKTT